MVLNASEFAARLGVSRPTVLRWLKAGAVHGEQEGNRGEWRIDEAELERVQRKRKEADDLVAPIADAAEIVLMHAGSFQGVTLSQAVDLARQIVELGDEWRKRAAGGAKGIVNTEIADTLTARVLEMKPLIARIEAAKIVRELGVHLMKPTSVADMREWMLQQYIAGHPGEPSQAEIEEIRQAIAELTPDELRDRIIELDEIRREAARESRFSTR